MRRIVYFAAGCITLWVVLAVPARYIWGDRAAVTAAAAMLVCALPAALTLAWCNWSRGRSPEQQMLAVLGGSGVRLAVVLATSLALWRFVPYFQQQDSFLVWLLVFYLFTLAFEVIALVAPGESHGSGMPRDGQPGQSLAR